VQWLIGLRWHVTVCEQWAMLILHALAATFDDVLSLLPLLLCSTGGAFTLP
jgi:hypothetical protein